MCGLSLAIQCWHPQLLMAIMTHRMFWVLRPCIKNFEMVCGFKKSHGALKWYFLWFLKLTNHISMLECGFVCRLFFLTESLKIYVTQSVSTIPPNAPHRYMYIVLYTYCIVLKVAAGSVTCLAVFGPAGQVNKVTGNLPLLA